VRNHLCKLSRRALSPKIAKIIQVGTAIIKKSKGSSIPNKGVIDNKINEMQTIAAAMIIILSFFFICQKMTIN